MAQLSDRVQTFTDSVIRRMTRISNQYGAINLSQGFPDFDPPRELTDALAQEAEPQPALLGLIRDFLQLLDERKRAFGTLLIGFQMKALQIEGSAPQLDRCMRTGSREDLQAFSIAEGGMLCGDCAKDLSADPLVFAVTPDQLSALRYMAAHPIGALKGIGLNEEAEKKLRRLFKAYYAYHLGIENLKSESLLI